MIEINRENSRLIVKHQFPNRNIRARGSLASLFESQFHHVGRQEGGGRGARFRQHQPPICRGEHPGRACVHDHPPGLETRRWQTSRRSHAQQHFGGDAASATGLGPLGTVVAVSDALHHVERHGSCCTVSYGVYRSVCRHLGRCSHRHHQRAAAGQFHSVCVLGYCVFPLNIATLVCMLAKVVVSHILLRMVIVAVGFLWSTRASVVFMSKLVPPKRKALTVYPVLLFYLFISWMVLIQ